MSVCEQTAVSRFMMGRHDIQIASIVISRDVNSEIRFWVSKHDTQNFCSNVGSKFFVC